MRSYISKSMMLGLALAAMTGCSTSGDKSSDQGSTGQIKMNIDLGAGNTLSSVTWTLTCTPTAAALSSGAFNVGNSNTVSGVIGGVPVGDTCSLVLSGSDSKNPAGNPPNCSVTVSNISAGSVGTASMVCQDPGSVTPAGAISHIGTSVTVTTATGASHQCAGIAWYTVNPAEVNVGSSIALFDATTTTTDGANAGSSWSGSDGFSAAGVSASYPCTVAGTVHITLSVQDNFTGPTGSCPPSTDGFDVTCTIPNHPGAGGATSTGGSSSTGGVATGGSAPAATGGTPPATGGSAPAATGGTPPATGGTPGTGGSSALPPGPELALLQANSAACGTCAQAQCSNFLDGHSIDTANGFGSCQTVTGAANGSNFDQVNEPWAATTWAGDPIPFTAAQAAAGGVAVTPFQLCMNLTTCLVQSKCDQGVLSACFCGAAVGTDCVNQNNYPGGCADPTNPTVTKGCTKAATGPINGACAGEEQNALDANTASTIPTLFGDVTLPGGPANQLVNCLANHCATQCSM